MNHEARQSGQVARKAILAADPDADFRGRLLLHDGGDGVGQGHSTGQAVADFVGKVGSVWRPRQLSGNVRTVCVSAPVVLETTRMASGPGRVQAAPDFALATPVR